MVRLIRRLGQLWDDDPRVAFVEMGILGQWGEQHDPTPGNAMQKLLAETYLTAFKHKLLMRRYADHFTNYPTLGLYWDSLRTRRTMNPLRFLPGEIAGKRSRWGARWLITGEPQARCLETTRP